MTSLIWVVLAGLVGPLAAKPFYPELFPAPVAHQSGVPAEPQRSVIETASAPHVTHAKARAGGKATQESAVKQGAGADTNGR